MPLVAGVDCSTQATKVLVVDSDAGTTVAAGRATHEVTGTGGARETDPEQWWRALAAALAETGRAHDVAAISVAGQQHGLVVLDAAGDPLRPAKLWNDTVSAADAAALHDARDAHWWADEIGVVPVPSFTVTKWAWLRRAEPDVAAATARVRLPHDFLTERLAGRGVTDRSDASGTGWWSTKHDEYASEVLNLERIGLDEKRLPIVLTPSEPAGNVTAAAAAALGIPSGVPVGSGTGDNAGAALGLGLLPGHPVISLGTSGTVFTVSSARVVDPSGLVAGFADATGRYLPLAATLNCTLAVDRIAGWLGLDREVAAGETSVVVLPYFDGERTPDLPLASATLTGLRHATTPGEILLAAYEGAALSLLEALDEIDRHGSGLDPEAVLVLIGGGARGSTWQRVIGRLSGLRIVVPAEDELVARGAAVQAAAALHGIPPDAVARSWPLDVAVEIDPVARDDDALERMRQARTAAGELLRGIS